MFLCSKQPSGQEKGRKLQQFREDEGEDHRDGYSKLLFIHS